MRSSITIDIKFRKDVLKNQSMYKVLKAIKNNNSIDSNTKDVTLMIMDQQPHSMTKIRNRCCVTGRGKGVYRRFKLSRIKLRESALKGELPCVRKLTW